MSERIREEWEYQDDFDTEAMHEGDPAYMPASKAYERSENDNDELRRMHYSNYLRTAHWSVTRRRAMLRAGRQCQRCESTRNLEVHHRTYERRGREAEADLTVLCARCHREEHRGAFSPDAALVLQRLEAVGASDAQIAELLADPEEIARIAIAIREANE